MTTEAPAFCPLVRSKEPSPEKISRALAYVRSVIRAITTIPGIPPSYIIKTMLPIIRTYFLRPPGANWNKMTIAIKKSNVVSCNCMELLLQVSARLCFT